MKNSFPNLETLFLTAEVSLTKNTIYMGICDSQLNLCDHAWSHGHTRWWHPTQPGMSFFTQILRFAIKKQWKTVSL